MNCQSARGHRLFGSPGRALGLLVNGWQTGSIFIWQSGAPFSIVSQYATFNRGGSRSVANTAVATLTHQQISGDLGVFKQSNGVVYLINPKLDQPGRDGRAVLAATRRLHAGGSWWLLQSATRRSG